MYFKCRKLQVIILYNYTFTSTFDLTIQLNFQQMVNDITIVSIIQKIIKTRIIHNKVGD